ncbi:MAG: hypothetical protein K2L50_01770 [Bacteroidales bacterium]|nr:hypothetical protein [Bacteroidales bacterium]
MLSEFQRSALGGDIIEDKGDVIYVGLFKPTTDETGQNNCLIKRIDQKEDPVTGNITIRTKYPNGNNSEMTDTWANRVKYNYEYSRSK